MPIQNAHAVRFGEVTQYRPSKTAHVIVEFDSNSLDPLAKEIRLHHYADYLDAFNAYNKEVRDAKQASAALPKARKVAGLIFKPTTPLAAEGTVTAASSKPLEIAKAWFKNMIGSLGHDFRTAGKIFLFKIRRILNPTGKLTSALWGPFTGQFWSNVIKIGKGLFTFK